MKKGHESLFYCLPYFFVLYFFIKTVLHHLHIVFGLLHDHGHYVRLNTRTPLFCAVSVNA
jgi:hypothetical protein